MNSFAVVNAEGETEAVERDLGDAVTAAASIGEVHIQAAEPEDHQLSGFSDAVPFEDMPKLAMRLTGLRPIRGEDVEAMSLEEAHQRLTPFFSNLPLERVPSNPRRGLPKVYNTPRDMADAFTGKNYKTSKETPEKPSDVQGLSLLPFDAVLGMSKRQLPMKKGLGLCAGSSAECRKSCLVYSGQNWIDRYNVEVKVGRTEALLTEPVAFCRMLLASIERKAKSTQRTGYEFFFRSNVYSDIPWELFFPDMFHFMSAYQFYDYTKVAGRHPPKNYDLTFSWSGRNADAAHFELDRGRRIAVVFLAPPGALPSKRAPSGARRAAIMKGGWFPDEFLGHRVVNGDVSDVRPRDPAPAIVALLWKNPMVKGGAAQRENNVFVVPVERVGDALVVAGNQRGTVTEDADIEAA